MNLIAVSCVSLAFKMKKTEYSVTDIQVHFSNNAELKPSIFVFMYRLLLLSIIIFLLVQQDAGSIFDIETIKRMELLILGSLKWRMRSITAFAFINFFISSFKFKDLPFQQALKARATEIIFTSQNGKSNLIIIFILSI